MGPSVGMDALEKRKNFHLFRIEPRNLGYPARNLVTVLIELTKWILNKPAAWVGFT